MILDDDKNFGSNEVSKKSYKDYLWNLTSELNGIWHIDFSRSSDVSKIFFLPFTRGQNSKWQEKFRNSALDFRKKYFYIVNGVRHYFTWNSYLGNSWDAIKFEYYEKHIRTMYEDLLDFYIKLSKINKVNKDSPSVIPLTVKWSNLADSEAANSLDEFKKSANSLVGILTKILYWKNFLGKEYENFENSSETIAQLFPALDRSDLEYNWVFAYRFLYDTLIPIYSANGWELPSSFFRFNLDMTRTQDQSHYVYEYALKYLNVIFKHKFKDFKELTIQNITDESLKKPEVVEANKKIFFEFLKTWKPRLDINISDTEY